MSDGYSIADVDWESKGDQYRVRIPKAQDSDEMFWMDVPPEAVITEPNSWPDDGLTDLLL
jgi:hypothetical protein